MRFSFNVKGGRCEACQGDGVIKVEMHFLPDVYVPCDVCHGKRYNRETLEVHYKGKSITEVLEMTVEDAHEFFKPVPVIARKLHTLLDIALWHQAGGRRHHADPDRALDWRGVDSDRTFVRRLMAGGGIADPRDPASEIFGGHEGRPWRRRRHWRLQARQRGTP